MEKAFSHFQLFACFYCRQLNLQFVYIDSRLAFVLYSRVQHFGTLAMAAGHTNPVHKLVLVADWFTSMFINTVKKALLHKSLLIV